MKLHTCPKCGKRLSNRHNLSLHKKNCQSGPYSVPNRYPIREKSLILSLFSDIPTFNAANDNKMFTTKSTFNATIHGSDKETGPRNPQITALLDEITYDKSPARGMDVASQKSLPPVAMRQKSSSTMPQPKSLLTVFPPIKSIVPPQPSAEDIAGAFPP